MKTKLSPRAQQKKSIKELCEENKKSLHHIDKKQVNLKAAEGSGSMGQSFAPSDDELAQINEFTRKTVTADEVATFSTMSCNDLFDRDDERFTGDTIDAFAALEPPYSFTGKSFMADHDYQMAKVRGRIFDTGTETVDGTNFVTNKIYVPNTPQYADYIENLDFGLAWAVSVGVVIDKANCTICDEPVYNSRFFGSWCASGHDKGYFYIPGEEEDDGWGGFIPVDPQTKGAVKAQVNLSDPIDAYELSQVFLGAQYMAELAKKPEMGRMLKAASVKSIPIIGLSHKEAADLPLPGEPEEVVEARQQYTVTTNDDGDPTWVDDTGLVWVYTTSSDTNTSEVQCLGRSADDGEEEQLGGLPREELQADEDPDPVSDDEPGAEPGLDGGEGDPGTEAGGSDPDDGSGQELTPDDNEEKTVSKQALVAALKAVKFPTDLVDKVEGVEGDDLTALLGVVNEHIQSNSKAVGDLTAKAALGDKFLKGLRADAVAWYVKAHQTDEDKSVNVDNFKKILDHCGDDVELLESLATEQKELAQAKFPTTVRRSTFESDHNDSGEPEETNSVEAEKVGKFAQRIHR